MSEYTVDIKIKPYLKDFLIGLYGHEPILASKTEILGLIIFPLLEKPQSNSVIYKYNKDESVKIALPYVTGSKDPRWTNYISEENQRMFNTLIYKIFSIILHNYLDSRVSIGYKIKTAILDFCDEYKLSPYNSNYETFKRSYCRYRKKK